MAVQALQVGSDEEAWKLLKTALDGNYDSSVVELEFNNWPVFQITVSGDRYDSTIPSSMMRSLVELQTHLYRVYAEIVYGKSARSLTAEERDLLEIVFKVESGSSSVFGDLSGFFGELGKNAMDKMTGKQVVTIVLGAAALWAGASSFEIYTENQQKKLEEVNQHELKLKLLEQQPKLMEIQNEQVAAFTDVLKSVSDANSVKLDDHTFSQPQIQMITASERQTTELSRIDDFYLVSSLKSLQDRYKIELTRISDDRNIPASLYKGHLSLNEMTRITDAFLNETSISLNVVARMRNDVITTANIIGIHDKAKGIALEDEKPPKN